jgi:dTDP-4-amino-4,6-dideoxygalactose transaminase
MPPHDAPDASASPSRIPFTRATPTALAMVHLGEAPASFKLGGGGSFSRRCETWLERELGTVRALLTHSCTGALEMAALLSGVGRGDEVIMPSFTFSSTANAFALRGAVPVFVDLHPGTLDLDERRVAAAIGPRTRVVVPVHYGGLACEMGPLLDLARRRGRMVIEDAAQAYGSTYRGRPLGTPGRLGCLSFHETRNLIAGERGALVASLRSAAIQAVSHYVPLHSSPAGCRFGRTAGALPVTDSIADQLLRLPLHAALTEREVLRVAGAIRRHFGVRAAVEFICRAA